MPPGKPLPSPTPQPARSPIQGSSVSEFPQAGPHRPRILHHLKMLGTYSVGHIRDTVDMGNRIVEEIAPVDRDMVARVKTGILHVHAGDQIVITYENATAPATAEVSPFRVFFGGQTNDAQVESINVFVQSAMPSQLALSSGGTVSADAGAAPLAVTVSLQDAAGMASAMVSTASVTLTSSSATGAFSETAGVAGTAQPRSEHPRWYDFSDGILQRFNRWNSDHHRVRSRSHVGYADGHGLHRCDSDYPW